MIHVKISSIEILLSQGSNFFLRSVMTHASVPADLRAKLGITDSLIRLSIGVEDVKDLIADLDQALQAAQA